MYTQAALAAASTWTPTDNDLRTATVLDQWHVYYQPIIDLRSGACVGAEALLRWRHPSRGLLTPDRFIATAEASAEIVRMTRWLMRTVAFDLKILAGLGFDTYAGVNLAPRHLHLPSVTDDLLSSIAPAGVAPARIVLELVERGRCEAITENALSTLRSLVRAGFRIALDDFGAGESDLRHLMHFPVSQVKIDKSLIDGIVDEPHDVAVLRLIADLIRSLGHTVVVEGVESQQQIAILRREGIAIVQGHALAQPMPLNSYVAFLRAAAASSHDAHGPTVETSGRP